MLELIAEVDKIRFAATQAFAETTRTVEGEAKAGHAPQQEEIMDIWIRAFMYNAWGLVKDEDSEDGWRQTEVSEVEELN